MSTVTVTVTVDAPPDVCFDLARSVEAHIASTDGAEERAVAGVTTGLLGLGDQVTWRARHLGVMQELTSRITAFDRPHYFRDEMVRGAFARFVHDHHFEPTSSGTIVRDVLDYSAPFGPIGRLVERAYLDSYLTAFLSRRAHALKDMAETGAYSSFFSVSSGST